MMANIKFSDKFFYSTISPILTSTNDNMSGTDVLREMLYRYYGYTHAGASDEKLVDIYHEKTLGNPGMWILPVERGFGDVFEQAVLESGKIGLRAKYNEVVMAPFN